MNAVESQYIDNEPTFLQSNFNIPNSTATPVNITEYYVTEDPITTTVTAVASALIENVTTDTILKNTTVDDVLTIGQSKIDDKFYIYIWAAAIFACIIMTTARFVLFFFLISYFFCIKTTATSNNASLTCGMLTFQLSHHQVFNICGGNIISIIIFP